MTHKMLSVADLNNAGIPVPANDTAAALKANAALEWLAENTTLNVSLTDPNSVLELPVNAKLFVLKYIELTSVRAGVSSQSIEGLNLSFDTGASGGAAIWQLATSLLGGYVRQVRVYPAVRRY